MVIREFESKDLDSVLKLFMDVVHTLGAKYYNSEQVHAWAPKNGPDRNKWRASLMNNFAYVAESNGSIIGFGDMTKDGYVDRLFVHKNHQGYGASRRIFNRLESDAKKLGLEEMTCEASIMVMPLAIRNGFEVVKKQTKVIHGVSIENYKMRKNL